jgi:hypothetical protein
MPNPSATLTTVGRGTQLTPGDRTAKIKRRLAENSLKGQQLVRTLGSGPAGEVFDVVLGQPLLQLHIKNERQPEQAVQSIADFYLDVDLENIARTGATLGSLASRLTAGSLESVATTYAKPPEQYDAKRHDSEAMKAAKWVFYASTTMTGRDKRGSSLILIQKTSDVIARAVAKGTPMNVLGSLDAINALLLDQGGRNEPRAPFITPKGPLPSSPAGRQMLRVAMRYLASRTPGGTGCAWKDLACYLLGAVIGCHGFPDANGRTARVFYSICWIRGGTPFVGLSPDGENELTGLPGLA